MSVWLSVQIVFAALAWYIAARAVVRIHVIGGHVGKPLARTIRELRHAGRAHEVERLGTLLGPTPLAPLFEREADDFDADQLVTAAQGVLIDVNPPLRMLRGLATVGTTLGLLAAIATLRSALDVSNTVGMEAAAGRAFDSAVLGFVTALPCWTAVALCRQRVRQLSAELDLVVLALRSEPASSAADEPETEAMPGQRPLEQIPPKEASPSDPKTR